MRHSPGAQAELSEWIVILFLLFSIIWKGGKGIEPTWMLAGVAFFVLLLVAWPKRQRRIRGAQETAEDLLFGQPGRPARGVPLHLWILLIGYFLWSALAQYFSATANYGLDEILRDGGLLLLFYWMVRKPVSVNEQDLSFAEKLLFTLAITAIGASLVGVAVYVLQPVNRFVGTFFDFRYHTDYWPNAWAEFLLLTWPLVLWFSSKTRMVTGTLLFGFVLGSLFLSYSRGAFLVFFGQILLLCFLSLGPRAWVFWQTKVWKKDPKKLLLRIACACAIGVITFFAINVVRAQFHEVESLTKKATFTAEEGKSSVNERRDFWEQSWALSQERPLFGWGPYSFRFIQPRLQHGVFETSDHPHNVYLKLGLERGWPTMLFFLLFTGFVFAGAFVVLLRPQFFDDPFQPMLAVSIVAVVGVLAHNLIDYNLQFLGIALPFWLLLGLIVSLTSDALPEPPLTGRWMRWLERVIALLLLIVALWEGRYLLISTLGRRAEAGGRLDEAIRKYDEARPQYFSRDMHLSRVQLHLDRNQTTEASSALDDYFAQNTEDPRAWKLRGDIDYLRQRYGEALAAYDQALWRGQYNNLSILYSVLKTLSIQKDTVALAERKAAFDRLLNIYADAISGNVHFIALTTNVEQFRDITDLLSLLYPADLNRYRTLSAKVWEDATRERARLSARSTGYLW